MAALSILTVKFVAIGLSKEMAGNYNSAYGFLQLFGILADFGLYAVAIREVSAAKDKSRVIGTFLVLRTVILLLSFGFAISIAWLMPSWRGTPLPIGITIAAAVPIFTLAAGVVRVVFQVTYKMHFVFVAEVLQRLVAVAAIGACIWWGVRGSDDLLWYELFLAFGGIGAFILLCVSVWFGKKLLPIKPEFDRALMASLAKKSLPYGLAFFCIALYRNLDVTLIALLRDDFAVQNAYYGFVLRMTEMALLIPTFLLNSTLPVLSDRQAAGENTSHLLGKTLFIILLLGTVAMLFSALWPKQLVLLLTTTEYVSAPGKIGSDSALPILGVSMFFNGMILYAFYVLLHAHKWQVLLRILAVGAAVSIALNIMIIPAYGFVGAATVSAVVHAVLACALLPPALAAARCEFSLLHFVQWIAFSALLAALLWGLQGLMTTDLHTAIGICAVGACIPIIAYAVGIHSSLLPRSDATSVKGIGA